MSTDTTVTAIFPTPVMHVRGLVDAETLERFGEALAEEAWFRNVHTELLTHTEVSDPSSSPVLRRVRKLALPKVVEFGELLLGEALRWIVKEMWVNVLHPGGHQATHSHANSFVSGVVYLTPSHPSSNLVLHRDAGGGLGYVFVNAHEGTTQGPYNAARWQSPDLAAGDMLLFPSYMLHAVPPNEGEKRVSVAFNAIPERLNSWGYEVRLGKA